MWLWVDRGGAGVAVAAGRKWWMARWKDDWAVGGPAGCLYTASGNKWSWSGGETLFCMFMMGENNLSRQMKRAVGAPDRHAVISQNEGLSLRLRCSKAGKTGLFCIFAQMQKWRTSVIFPVIYLSGHIILILCFCSATFDVTWDATWSGSPVSVWERAQRKRPGEPSVCQILADRMLTRVGKYIRAF